MKVRYSYLPQQFADVDEVFAEMRELVSTGAFTLGRTLVEFEEMFAELLGVKHAIGVGSGTDTLKLSLKALDVGFGDEVITCANTFYATVGAIAEVGARPVFVDCTDDFQIDVAQIEAAITPQTKALMPVHLTGAVADMPRIMEIAEKHGLPVVEDACQSLLAERGGQKAGTWGAAGGFSLHPLKIIHVWGDGGIVVTNDDEMNRKLRLLRNHGLRNRDEMEIFGYNSRLDPLQAIVGKWIVRKAQDIVDGKKRNGAYYDAAFKDVPGVRIPPMDPSVDGVYLLYILFAENRDGLLAHCLEKGIEAKVHYPVALYLQDALKFLGHKKGDFPVTDRHVETMITFPVDQHLSQQEMDYVIETVRNFYSGGK
ncbi:MAG: DegT/DnrJ/EryC1/StrS family aminotransferase [Rhodospirillaceae bacterium]|jgi:dTDP-3-amino-2,3,6-trideoxy-4-keto-D-glucose/dTDP-3-amino-3,4,6-trideoxy-alpha-D-glucose/dTDP-2,6-dideoxy-D-kanosamine transaminase|nr:DegT/DnrJ/EryC1/StrS family aminotransferase [Rhodospirillaceae bacterium]MBT5373847.1 DegT/DnrJ/EryC1/StrS family aminotransferase [Rhodospirillaceae bacterium]MBT5659618.1 DegT/DnrJ/EryC1/StrS family aminotransferase [Rhodospirillaceae bacterium]MBT5752056.1 DegT/DnrJ/EryC1/StrS family aminotransferase [Rhodospirillaceae bacterium]